MDFTGAVFDAGSFTGVRVASGIVSFTTVAAVALGLTAYDREKVHHARIGGPLLAETTSRILTSTRATRSANPVIHSGRVDVIGAGALILHRLFTRLPVDDLVVSERDLLDGVALSLT